MKKLFFSFLAISLVSLYGLTSFAKDSTNNLKSGLFKCKSFSNPHSSDCDLPKMLLTPGYDTNGKLSNLYVRFQLRWSDGRLEWNTYTNIFNCDINARCERTMICHDTGDCVPPHYDEYKQTIQFVDQDHIRLRYLWEYNYLRE